MLETRQTTGLRLTQRRKLALEMRQALGVMVMPVHELAEHTARMAAANPFVTYRPPQIFGPAVTVMDTAGPCGLFGRVLEQIPFLARTQTERRIALALAEELDDRGYLGASVSVIAQRHGLEPAIVARVLARLQEMEPAGVFARTLKECLGLQLRARGRLTPLAVAVLNVLESLRTPARVSAFARRQGADPRAVQAVLDDIRILPAHPAAGLDAGNEIHLIPDLEFHHRPTGWEVSLCRQTQPHLALNEKLYQRLEAASPDEDSRRELRQKWSEARSLVAAVATRERTLLRLGRVLAERQATALGNGLASCCPLTRREVAQGLGLHESTLSRIVAHRMALVGGRMTPLARFFERARRNAASADTRSQVLMALRTALTTESRANPLSDERLAHLLGTMGYAVSRRRIAKYRALCGIPGMHQRTAGQAPSPARPDPHPLWQGHPIEVAAQGATGDAIRESHGVGIGGGFDFAVDAS